MSKRKKILIVDDEPDLREIVADEFRFDGDEVIEASNGVQAFAMYQENKPDVVISDIRMPGGDGVTLAKNIKNMDPLSSRVFLITGFADLSPAEAYDFGIDGFFTKPFHLEAIRQGIAKTYLPPEERWKMEARENIPLVAEISLLTLDWKADFKSGVFAVGRGGFFLPQSKMIALSNPLRVGEIVAVKAGIETLGYFTVRWVRTEAKETTNGIGLEFLALQQPFLEVVVNLRAQLTSAAYIPSKLTS